MLQSRVPFRGAERRISPRFPRGGSRAVVPPRALVALLVVGALVLVDARAGAAADGTTPTPEPTPTSTPTTVPSPVPEPGDGPDYRPASKVKLRKTTKGTWIVRGRSPVYGKHGKVVRYTVEAQRGMPNAKRRAAQLAAVTRWVFGDTEHGWTAKGERRMRRVGSTADAKIRVVLATPSKVDAYCRRGGAYTGGKWSCFNGFGVAALNAKRWRTGPTTAHYPSLDQYRAYLVDHEVGHGLGYGHRTCPRKGALANVMLPQSRVFYGCRPNGWPYPHGAPAR